MLAKFSAFFRRPGSRRPPAESVADVVSLAVPTAHSANMAREANGHAAPAPTSTSQSDSNVRKHTPVDSVSENNQKPSVGWLTGFGKNGNGIDRKGHLRTEMGHKTRY